MDKEIFTSKEKDILDKNKKFFSSSQKYIDIILSIITGKSDISIRVLDWFVANYSKKNDTSYIIKIKGKKNRFNVNNEYKNQLNGYSKQYFDPFCRKKKIIYKYENDDINIKFISSIGQLNFFEWAIKNKVIKYVGLHLNEIEIDMKETSKKNKENKIINSELKKSIISEEESTDTDPFICSSENINNIIISPKSPINTDSDKNKRQRLTKSIYDSGIKKSTVPVKLDFD